MKGAIFVAGIAALGTMALAAGAFADPFDPNLNAKRFSAAQWSGQLVQAMDECTSGTTVIGGIDACAPANVATDGTQFRYARLAVKSRIGAAQVVGIVRSQLNGDTPKALAGKTLRIRLVLRITKRATTSSPTEEVTWVDQVLDCAPVTVGSDGNFLFKGQLAGALGCNLDPALADEGYAKEVVSASIVDATSGKAIAVPGVRKR
jgi:hypothetical protein